MLRFATLASRSSTVTATLLPTQPLYLILRRKMSSNSSSSSSSSLRVPGPIVSVDWLKSNYSHVKVVDGSWYMPSERQDAHANFIAARLPSARFFDLEACTSKEGSNVDLPHMLPSATQLSSYLSTLDLSSSSDAIVVYDGKGIFSAPRIRFTLNHFGMNNVAILEGGIKEWKAQGGEIETGQPKNIEGTNAAGTAATSATLPLTPTPDVIHSMSSIVSNISTPVFQLVDARSAGRFAGSDPEPRADIPSGHVAGAINVPFTSLLRTDEKSGATVLRPVTELESVFASCGVNPHDSSKRLVASCGSGVTACVVLLGLEMCGRKTNVGLYDGSWTEYALRKNTITKS